MIISKIFDKDIAVNVHYKPLPLLSFYKNLGYKLEDFTNSKNFWEQEITLPVYYNLNDKQIQDVVKAVVSSYNEVIE
jgi:dTDP-4-amino-4,6-dideoxygalactose transaminase